MHSVYPLILVRLHCRFSAFFKEKWGEGIGELAKHMRADGGMHAPWLKVWMDGQMDTSS